MIVSKPAPLHGFNPFFAPAWAQPYLDCVNKAIYTSIGGRWVRVEMYRGTGLGPIELVGVVMVEVPEKEKGS